MQSVEHPLDPEELNEYLDGELSLERRVDVESHLAGCAGCQKTVRDLRGVSRELTIWSVEEPPDTLRVRSIVKKVQGGQRWRLRWLPSWATMPAVAAAGVAVSLLIVLFGPLYMTQSRPPSVAASNESAQRTTEGSSAAGMPEVPPPPVTPIPLGGQGAPARVGRASSAVMPEHASQGQQMARGPRIIRTATLQLVPKDFDAARAAVDRIVANAGGYLGSVVVSGARPTGRTLAATVNVPAARLDETVSALRALGDVVQESQNATDVSEQLVDLEARLANSRNTERRMNELLRTRTGKLSEVLEAEREVARVREEIERLDAQRRNLDDRVTYSAITVQFNELQKSSMNLGPLPLSTRIRNAFVDGVRGAFSSAVAALLLVLQIAPALVFWGVVLEDLSGGSCAAEPGSPPDDVHWSPCARQRKPASLPRRSRWRSWPRPSAPSCKT